MKVKLSVLSAIVWVALISCDRFIEKSIDLPEKPTHMSSNERQILTQIYAINRTQQAYHFEIQKFANSLQDLRIIPLSDLSYSIEIDNIELENITYTKAISNGDRLPSFVGGVYYDKQIGSYNNIICQSDRPGKVLAQSPTVIENKLKCPPNFRYLPDFVIDRTNPSPVRNKEIEAKNSIDTIIRLEQLHYLERGIFTDDLQSLDYPLPENRFYSFKIQIPDQKFVHVTAIPSQDDLPSIVGASLYNDRTSSFEKISCQSDRPGKVEAEPPIFIDDKLKCSENFYDLINSVTTEPRQESLTQETEVSSIRVRELEARNGIRAIMRAEQAHHFETISFTDDWQGLGYTPSENPFYDFKIYVSEDKQFVHSTIIPNSEGLPSFIGGVYFNKQTNQYQSLSCQSREYSKIVPEAMTLENDRLDCPANFEELP